MLYIDRQRKKELAYHHLIQAMPVGQQMTITSAFYRKSKNIPVVLNNTEYATILLRTKHKVKYESNISSSRAKE